MHKYVNEVTMHKYVNDERVTALDVRNAYRLFLGREPENEFVVKVRAGHSSLGELREEFIFCEEFTRSYPQPSRSFGHISLDDLAPPQDIEYEVSEEQLQRCLRQTEKVWSNFGETVPHWSVVTHSKFLPENMDENAIEEFYAQGAHNVKKLEMALRRCGEWKDFSGLTCMEYGCGLGRITTHLAKYFKTVVGMDISQNHLDIAQKVLEKKNIQNVELKKVSTFNDINYGQQFDLIYSLIVLQHNTPPAIVKIIDSFFKIIKPGGIVAFQVPVRIKGYSFIIDKYLEYIDRYHMEMHALPQHVILKTADANNCKILKIQCDDQPRDKDALSQCFIFKKS